ncbi:MAG TPA: phasin family protein [Burkholderiales bacterium]
MASKNSQARLARQVSESGREIWLAGLGAFATARQEGNKLFDLLVKEGKGIEARTRAMAGSSVKQLRSQATGTLGKLERVFEQRVAQAMKGIGVPTSRAVEELSQRVAQLDRSVATLVGRKSGGRRRARKAHR